MITEKILENYFDRLFPLNRSITGVDYRKSLNILSEKIPFKYHDFKSGEKCYDWIIPKEWNVKNAYIKTPDGKIIADFKKHNLHLMGYSTPVNRQISYKELINKIHTIKEMPHAIPYATSYYKKNWGFCLKYNELKKLPKKGKYNVLVDSSLKNGFLRIGTCTIPGVSKKEILISTYLCHPSMAVNELSGPLLALYLYDKLRKKRNYYTIRFVICPETIGSIAFLKKFGKHLKKELVAGYVLTCIGIGKGYMYKRSRNHNDIVDQATIAVLKKQKKKHKLINFFPGGSDEKQYSTPGFNFPIGLLMGKIYGTYKEYHTSLDNKKIISFKKIIDTGKIYLNAINLICKFRNKTDLESNKKKEFKKDKKENYYFSTIQHGMPFFSKKKKLPYPEIMKSRNLKVSLYMDTVLEILNYSDGEHNLKDISKKTKKKLPYLVKIKNILLKAGYLKKI